MRYQIKEVQKLSHYEIYKSGKLIKTFTGHTSYDDAHEYTQDCVEDDRLYAHFYSE